MVHDHHVDPDSKCAKHHGQVKWPLKEGDVGVYGESSAATPPTGVVRAVMTGVQTVHVYEVFLRA